MKVIKIMVLCGIILMTAFSCEKDNPKTVEFFVKLVNDKDAVIDTFEKGDSVFFKFYLVNNMGREVTYIRPRTEIRDFLKVFRQNLSEDYEYIGIPNVIFAPVGIYEKVTINKNETKLIASVPIDFTWPEMNPGNYYVGDTLKLKIDDERRYFIQRIYFTIK